MDLIFLFIVSLAAGLNAFVWYFDRQAMPMSHLHWTAITVGNTASMVAIILCGDAESLAWIPPILFVIPLGLMSGLRALWGINECRIVARSRLNQEQGGNLGDPEVDFFGERLDGMERDAFGFLWSPGGGETTVSRSA